jgi:hypothetical protein
LAELTLLEKLAKIRGLVEVMEQSKKGYNYKYVPEDEILAKVLAGMEKYNISLVPSIVQGTNRVVLNNYNNISFAKSGDKIEKTVSEIFVYGDMVYTWYNNSDRNDKLEVPWFFVGHQDDASKAFGSGLSYSSRYFLLKYFNVATVADDDADQWYAKKKEAEDAENNRILNGLIEKIGELSKAYCGKDEKKRKAITDFFESVITVNGSPTANFAKIKDLEMAAEVLRKTEEYINKNKGGNK